MIYKVGKSITVLGSVLTSEQGKIGEHEYTFPVLQAKGIKLWKNVEKYNVQTLSDPYWDSPYLYSPFYPNYRRSTVIVTKQSGAVKTPASTKNNTQRLK
jgi:outer membrane lipoprotein